MNQRDLVKMESLVTENIEYVCARAKTDYPVVALATLLDVDIIKFLINHGGSPLSLSFVLPLQLASSFKNSEIYDYLIEIGGNFEQPDCELNWAMSPICFAVLKGISEGIRSASRNGIKPKPITRIHRLNELHVAAREGKPDIIKTLIEVYAPHDLDINCVAYQGYTALQFAAEYGKLTAVSK
jgi:ankyrin repeat protein